MCLYEVGSTPAQSGYDSRILADLWILILCTAAGAAYIWGYPTASTGGTILGEMSAREEKLDDDQFALISKALADPKRFEMLQRIAGSKQAPTCSCVCQWLGLAPATVSHHLRELESAGLVNVQRDGKFAYISLRRDVLDAYVNRLSSL
jgi:ArsR family transcriptional regulator